MFPEGAVFPEGVSPARWLPVHYKTLCSATPPYFGKYINVYMYLVHPLFKL